MTYEFDAAAESLALMKASAIDIGNDLGRKIGDELAAEYAAPPPGLDPWLLEALRMEQIFRHYCRVKEAEDRMIAEGVREPVSTAFRIAAACAVAGRLKLAGVTTLVTGQPN